MMCHRWHFIDTFPFRLYAGKFDSHLLKNIQAAKHFILVLTPRNSNQKNKIIKSE